MTVIEQERVESVAATLQSEGRKGWLTTGWDAFCDCDELPAGIDYDAYVDWLDATPLVASRGVEPDDLEDPFAWERGIEPGGMVYVLTPLGLAVRDYLRTHPANEESVK